MATPKRAKTTPTSDSSTAGTTLLAFLAGWQQLQEGAVTAGRSVVLHYEPARLSEAQKVDAPTSARDIVGYARFLPSGVVRHTTMHAPTGRRTKATSARVAAEIAIPHETRHVELWFKGVDAHGETTWDSRFGFNYRYDVERPQPSADDTLAQVPAALVDATRISIEMDAAVKENGFPSRDGYSSGMTSQETSLRVAARVRGKAVPRAVWVEARTFDGDARVISSESRPLVLDGAVTPDGARYVLDDLLYRGAVATPGSVTPKPDVRMVQYRVYCTVGRKTYTDGVLHRCELATDAMTP